MIPLVLLFLLAFSLEALEHSTQLSLKHIDYNNFKNESILQGETKLQLQNEAFTSDVTLEYLYSDEYKERRYLLLNELYFTKELQEYSLSFGKTIKYWGELEGFNIADIYNQKNYLLDPFNKDKKVGTIAYSMTKYLDEDSIEFGVKLYEDDFKYPSKKSPYYPFPINYEKGLKLSDSRFSPSLYFIYSFITEDSFDSENRIIFYNGYDNKRYFVLNDMQSLSQYAYRVNKILFLSNLVYKDMIFKNEMSYTNVISDKNIADYAQISLGVEKTFYDILGSNLSLYTEYYNYTYMQKNKIKNVDISEIYDNDIFLALRIDFQDLRDSELKGGVLYDLERSERVFKVEFKSRIRDNLVLHSEFLQIVSREQTVLFNIGDSLRGTLGITYSF